MSLIIYINYFTMVHSTANSFCVGCKIRRVCFIIKINRKKYIHIFIERIKFIKFKSIINFFALIFSLPLLYTNKVNNTAFII